jgi:hypothetical protein
MVQLGPSGEGPASPTDTRPGSAESGVEGFAGGVLCPATEFGDGSTHRG